MKHQIQALNSFEDPKKTLGERQRRWDQIKYRKLITVEKVIIIDAEGYKKIYGKINQDYATDLDIAIVCDRGNGIREGAIVHRVDSRFICFLFM